MYDVYIYISMHSCESVLCTYMNELAHTCDAYLVSVSARYNSESIVPQFRVLIPYLSTCSECKGPPPKAVLLFLRRQQAHRCPTARIQRISKDFKRFPVLTGVTETIHVLLQKSLGGDQFLGFFFRAWKNNI